MKAFKKRLPDIELISKALSDIMSYELIVEDLRIKLAN